MTPFDNLINFLLNQNPVSGFWAILKIFFLIALGLYLAFAAIMVRQVSQMSHSVDGGGMNVFVKIISILHLLASILLFVLALAIL